MIQKINLKLFLVSLSIVVMWEALMRFLLFQKAASPSLLLGGTRVLEIFSLILLFYLPAKDLSLLGLNRSGIGRGIRKGLIWSLGFGVLVMAVFVGLRLIKVNPLVWFKMRLPGASFDLFIFFLIGGLIGPVAEEIFFRGIVYGFFRRWGVITALILSTVIFVLLHLPIRSFPLPQAVGGMLFALAYELEKTLYTPIVIHIVGNLAIFFLSFFV